MRVILDINVIRGICCEAAARVAGQFQPCDRLAAIDTLFFEIASTDDDRQWEPTLRKLAAFGDRLEVWEHIGVAADSEMKHGVPYGEMADGELARKLGGYIQSGSPRDDGFRMAVSEGLLQREQFHALHSRWFAELQDIVEDLHPCDWTEGQPSHVYEDFVNDEAVIRGILPGNVRNSADASWIIWHLAKSRLAMYCIHSACNGPQRVVKTWSNTKHDADYLVALSRADLLVSNEVKDQFRMLRWMYGASKGHMHYDPGTGKLAETPLDA